MKALSSLGGGGGVWSTKQVTAMAAPTRLTMIRLTTPMRRPPSVNASTRSPTCTVCAGLTLTSLMLTCPARHAAEPLEGPAVAAEPGGHTLVEDGTPLELEQAVLSARPPAL